MDIKTKQSVLTKYHIDPDTKKPTSVPVVEKQQVHPLKNLIQMIGEVKKNKKIQIIDRDMIPVNKPEKITQPYHYYVDYEQNLIHFHPDIAGQTIEYKYEDMGVTVISANKIFTKQDEKGNVVELLEDIINMGREAIDVMLTIGGVAIIMKRLEDDIKEGYEVSDKIQADIQQAKDEILNVRGNKEVIIKSSDWTLNSWVSGGYTYKTYEKEITHDLNSENLHVTAKNSDTKEAVTIGYKILDKTRILLKSDEAINMSVVLSASYYHATQTISDNIAEEVVKARKGELDLKTKIDSIDNCIVKVNEQLDKMEQENINLTNKTNMILSIEDLLRDISNGNIYKIRWIGDSVSVGYDSTGAEPDPDGEVIFNYGGDIHKAPKENSIGYVNRIRILLQSYNPSIKLVNASMSGRSAKEAYRMKEGYYLSDGQHDHVAFVALGLNDLHMCANIQEFKTAYDGLIKYFKTISDKVICITPTPVLREHLYTSENGTTVNLKVKDVCLAIKEVANNNDCYVLDLNTEIMKMVNNGSININDFYKDDVLHPSDNGHTICFKALCDLLGVKLNDDLFLLPTVNYKELELQNNWLNASFDSNDLKFGCMFIGKNRVRIKGILKDGVITNGTIITNLPSIYRPSKKQYFNTIYNDGAGVKSGVLTLSTNGDLAILGNVGSNWLNIDIEVLLN